MSYKDIKPGDYAAQLTDWGIKMAAEKPMAWIAFELAYEGEAYTLNWEQWFLKKDGTPNKNVQNTLPICGFKGQGLEAFADAGALDTKKSYVVSVVVENGYPKVQWVNDENSKSVGAPKKVSSEQVDAATKAKIAAMFGSQVKNHAPQSSAKSAEEELGF